MVLLLDNVSILLDMQYKFISLNVSILLNTQYDIITQCDYISAHIV
jgi:hypothetical protein